MKTSIWLFIITLSLLSSCLSEDRLHLLPNSIRPIELGDGHEIAEPNEVNMDAGLLQAVYDGIPNNEDLWSIRSLLVLRKGKLVAEHYYKDPQDIEQQHLVWSCTKQIMGLLVGKAIEDGLIEDIDDPISNYLPNETAAHPDKKDISIRHLLTMQSGIAFSNDGTSGQTDKLLRQLPEDCIEFVLDLPMKAEPGTVFNYNDGDPLLLSAIIQSITGVPTDVWAHEVLFKPLAIANYSWRRYKDGVSFGGFGIETTPRELAKIGLCVLDSGRYRGQQIIESSWLSAATSSQVNTDFEFDFGYQWWIEPIRDLKIMWGHGGQLVFIDSTNDLVMVVTAFPNTQGKYQISAQELFPVFDELVKAIK